MGCQCLDAVNLTMLPGCIFFGTRIGMQRSFELIEMLHKLVDAVSTRALELS